MKHSMVLNLCGGRLQYAPLENPQEIIDMGTGTGIWCIDMGDEYPSAEILGVDLSPIQPTWVPPNVRFMVDDVESPWLHKPNHFDFVHGRHLSVAIKDMPKMLSEAYRYVYLLNTYSTQPRDF
jgi:ubiquinone/menaquinone biosynthesis C-methylase UbiE